MKTKVYILEFNDKIKIGITDNLKRRISAIQCASGDIVKRYFVINGTKEIENKMHIKLKSNCIAGEFFRFNFISACKILCELTGINFNEEDIIKSNIKPNKRTGRPITSNPKNERLYIRVSSEEKKEITEFAKENGYALLELIIIGIRNIKDKK